MRPFFAIAIASFGLVAQAFAAIDFEEVWSRQVEPVLDKYCFKCHAGVRQKGGLDLRSLQTMLRGGENGPALIPGDPAKSHIIQYIQAGADPHMPPEEKKQLNPEEIAVLTKWVGLLPKTGKSAAELTNSISIDTYIAGLNRSKPLSWNPPAKTSVSQAIDGYLSRAWKEKKVKPSSLADDSAYARRLYLDLAGRIPTPGELETFLAEKKQGKRERLADQLLAGDEYAREMREVFDVLLMGRPARRNEAQRRENGWVDYLERSFKADRPWNQMVRDMIIARGTNSETRGAFWFLYERQNSHQAMAEALGPIGFGVNMKCAQCHNHPLAWEIEQRHYWGLVSALNRSKGIQTASGPAMSESAIGGFVNFSNLKKESQPALLVFLNGKSIEEKWPGADAKEEDKPDLYVVPPGKGDKPKSPSIPRFSRREALAEVITRENPFLARAFVNRVWALLMGRGLVHPVDQMDSRHKPSHPELLDWLARDFERSGYEVKRLVRGIVTSRAYQLASKPSGRVRPRLETFACAIEKPLTAEQLLRSLLVAAQGALPSEEPAELRKLLITTFPEVMPANYSPSLQQALFLSNSPLIHELVTPAKQNTTAQLCKMSDPALRVKTAFLRVLNRLPDAAEERQFEQFLAGKPAEKASRDLVWALLVSAEFQLNH